MPAIPGFVLKRLYVAGSLRKTPEGVRFSLHNKVGAGTLLGVPRASVDGAAVDASRVRVLSPGSAEREAASITRDAPLAVPANAVVSFLFAGAILDGGTHTVTVELVTREAGSVELPVTDTVRDGGEGAGAGPTAPAPLPAARPVAPANQSAARPLRVVIIGAGSAVFARQLMADVLRTPGLESGTFALVDVDPSRLALARRIGSAMVRASGRGWKVLATTDRRKALRGADYVISTIEVAGLRNVRHDYDIPLRYGVDQCIGDTIGPGGIFKLLRTGPAWLEILRDIEELCPRAIVMNYSNPMSALTLLALRATTLAVVGLCHSVQNTAEELAGYLDVPRAELSFRCAGINHLAWFTQLTHRGEDQYPRLARLAQDSELWEADPVRFEVLRHFGAFVTESSGHLSEYLPYFRKRPELVARYTRGGYRGESGYYAKSWPGWRAGGDDSIREMLDGRSPLALARGGEYASRIIEAVEGGAPAVIHGNVANAGLIDNLPAGGCVEVPVLVDAAGMHPVRFGPLPVQMAALSASHMPVHELMARAVLERDLGAARHALLLDPLTAAVCSPDEASSLFDEMVKAERQDLGAYLGRRASRR